MRFAVSGCFPGGTGGLCWAVTARRLAAATPRPGPAPAVITRQAGHSLIAARSPVMSSDADSSRTTAGPCSRLTEADYDGTAPFAGGSGPPATFQGRAEAAATAAFVVVPFAGLGVAVWLAWGHGLNLGRYPARSGLLRDHRAGRDRRLPPAADPPQLHRGPGAAGRARGRGVDELRGRGHRLGRHPPPPSRLRRPARRPALPCRRHDRATNLWPLALVSFGESWHNMHHSDPACARHGAEPGQIDLSAAVIRLFEHLGWATAVHWPVPARLAARRRNPAHDQPQPAPQPEDTTGSGHR
jgi:hypothetical protein